MSVELRKNGPLILIIDDVQWADADSLAVLERLRDSTGGSLGMITISRSRSSGTTTRGGCQYRTWAAEVGRLARDVSGGGEPMANRN